MDLLLDTNILIDHFGNRPQFAKDAHKVMAMGYFGDVRLWVTPHSLVDLLYILRKTVNSNEIQKALYKSLTFLNVCNIGHEELSLALQRSWNDLEDCLVSVSAEKIHADYIVTRDEKGFSQGKIQSITPQDLLVRMKEQYNLVYDFEDEE